MNRRRRASEAVPHPNTLLVAQSETDACLHRRLRALGVRVEHETRLRAFRETSDGVLATVQTQEREEVIGARYLVGADGGGSVVRKQLGVAFLGSTDDSDRMIVADVVVDSLSRDRWHVWPRSAGRFMALCPLPGGERFQLMLRLRPDEEADLDSAALDRLVRGTSGRAALRVRDVSWSSVFRPNVRMVERYRQGNVFLAGDAGHVHTPAGAQGLNTGVQDAYNLGWKLGQAIAGAPDSLLDTYESERLPVAARVLRLSSELYAGVGKGRVGSIRRGDEERQLELNYRGGPLSFDGGFEDGPVRSGDRAPDARYVDVDGRHGRLFDAFRGPHFTLLAFGEGAIRGLDGLTWPGQGAPLRTLAVPLLCRAYGLREPAQVLVRPDGYVAYVAPGDWGAMLTQATRVLCATKDSFVTVRAPCPPSTSTAPR
jgi:2-polyprenyl-6-methoxyphenol hydroxylase-like FAD-dependent oxidoreductase